VTVQALEQDSVGVARVSHQVLERAQSGLFGRPASDERSDFSPARERTENALATWLATGRRQQPITELWGRRPVLRVSPEDQAWAAGALTVAMRRAVVNWRLRFRKKRWRELRHGEAGVRRVVDVVHRRNQSPTLQSRDG